MKTLPKGSPESIRYAEYLLAGEGTVQSFLAQAQKVKGFLSFENRQPHFEDVERICKERGLTELLEAMYQALSNEK